MRKAGWLEWLPWFRNRVRMGFPCPACFHPLVAEVEPDLDLECPVCRTSFKVPAPPPPMPPPPRVVVVQPGVEVLPKRKGVLDWGLLILGYLVAALALVAPLVGWETYFTLVILVIFLIGLFASRIKDYLRRRKNPALPRLQWRQACEEGVQAIGAVAMAIMVIPCVLGMIIPFIYVVSGYLR